MLSLEEVMLVLKTVNNLKHQALLYLTYSSGLRVGEVVRLRIGDCDHSREILLVRQGKGRKDQITLLSDALILLCVNILSSRNLIHGYFPGKALAGT
ncbi:tyrosine-type recombinase/integrase [Paenibacillus sp. 19GGS1-52]|uniref:tyrosine-type recombinase/integrase n=1 Tax=Paenibacillus sp. 19GGS1-52 TaxID=2758563 RepID=UPI0023BAEE22|nr:tyrosine-type recombinase/integrase [Paenibacillus sp. 19GGS1-52]